MLTSILISTVLVSSSFGSRESLEGKFKKLEADFDGKAGICALAAGDEEPVCVNGSTPLPLQSVMKLIVGAVAMKQVDAGTLKLDEIIPVKPADISPGPEDFARLIISKGTYPATVEELIRRSIVDSDSTAVDVLIKHLGGITVVQDFLRKQGIPGLRVDRNERDLQSEFSGLSWQESYADLAKFEAAVAAVPAAKRVKAIEAYLKDPRDTATPAAMVKFIAALASGQMLSPASTQKLLSIMEMTATGKDRLRAGVPAGWKIGHKTGTSGSWQGRYPTTNDAGLLTAPDGGKTAIAVFLSDSQLPDKERAAVIAEAARAVTAAYKAPPSRK